MAPSATANTLDALGAALLGSDSIGGGYNTNSESWGDAQRVATAASVEGFPVDADHSSLELESSFLMREGREPTQEELVEYLQKHKLQAFLTEVLMYVARHYPPDPFEFLLSHIGAMVMKHRAQSVSASVGTSATKVDDPEVARKGNSGVAAVSAETRQKVAQSVAAALRSDAATNISAEMMFKQFSNGQKMTEENFRQYGEYLEGKWGLQAEDRKVMLEALKRWRFRANIANGTRGHPLWPMTRQDFMLAYGAVLRAVRDRYVPIGGRVHRSMFVRLSAGGLEDAYELGPKLGRGAYGEVRIVTSKKSQERRVSKRVERRQQRLCQDELLAEVDLLRGLDHPHIIRVFEFFEAETHIDMIMEACFGGTLSKIVQSLFLNEQGEHLRQRPALLEESWIATLMAQVLGALTYAHTVAGVIHKDIKTDNVLLVGRPDCTFEERMKEPLHAMLADFGIAEVFVSTQQLTLAPASANASPTQSPSATPLSLPGRSERVGGTPSYMSPEMFKGSFTEKSDIWSLGVVAFMLFTGQLPYSGENLLLQAHMVCNPRKHPPWDLLSNYKFSLGARWFCQQLLCKEESARPSAQDAGQDPWVCKASAALQRLPPTTEERMALHGQHLQSHLTKMACTCITSQLSLSQLHLLNDRFKHYDTSGDGRLGHVEMRQVLVDVGVAPEDIDVVIESLDSDRSGVIEYSEFIAGCIDVSDTSMRQQLRVTFDIFDLDGSGFIGLSELRAVLTAGANSTLAPSRPEIAGNQKEVSEQAGVESILPDGKTVEEVMEALDSKKDGMIHFPEFEKYILAEHRQVGQALTDATAARLKFS
eukprot:TRINITY_DN81073_c0_g1_i1.p1 TRINITY_DN81073_c0_g1~~TRINITY_DN81073_c0_g1_i1.p1  ORF type:complete len:820 (+),score=210.23 TRINITY_DN81073_c0_g1_i1:79-2538(+)